MNEIIFVILTKFNNRFPLLKNTFVALRSNYRTIFSVAILVLIFSFSRANYLFLHTIVELFSIVVAFAVFIVAWNSRKMLDNNFLYFVGSAFLFIGGLDLLHTLSFKGMNIIDSPAFYANQFWIATRFLQAITFLGGFWLLTKKKAVNAELTFLAYTIVSALIILSILYWQNFPVCYIEGQGQTAFKIYAEYVIIWLLLAGVYLLFRYKSKFDQSVFKLLLFSMVFTILSEFCFTLYVSNYSISNELGHYAKLISFFLIYKALVSKGFSKPTELIFKNLKNDEEKYRTLSEELQATEKALQELNSTKDKFFSLIAHDLKNPFTSLIAFSELIYRNSEKLGPDKIKNIAIRMNDASKNAYTLLENLLDWSRLQTGALKPALEKIQVSDLLEESLNMSQGMATAKDISIEIEDTSTGTILADGRMITTILRNLISNAIKFSFPESVIKITASNTQKMIQFSIKDSGVGIEEDKMASIFNNANPSSTLGTKNEKGSGLGLILCKEFIELNNGEIWLESEKNQGTTFYFKLPASIS